jgi:hypothetical protein
MKCGWAFLLMSCSVLFTGCIVNTIDGSGKLTTETRAASDFSRVALSGSGRLVVDQGATESVTVTADDNLLPYIRTEMRGNTLELGFTDAANDIRPTKDVVFKVSAKRLQELIVSGSGVAEAKGVDSDSLRVTISGSGDVTADGSARDLDVVVSGSGGYRGDGMRSTRARVHVSGSGDALVAASDTLEADVSGSGTIEYIGFPRVSEHVSGSGSVRRR